MTSVQDSTAPWASNRAKIAASVVVRARFHTNNFMKNRLGSK
jgi:hypothetical protein